MVENGQFYYSMRDVIVNENRFQGKRLTLQNTKYLHKSSDNKLSFVIPLFIRCTYVETPKYTSLEIDTLEDSEMAKWLMTSRKELWEQKQKQKKTKNKEKHEL